MPARRALAPVTTEAPTRDVLETSQERFGNGSRSNCQHWHACRTIMAPSLARWRHAACGRWRRGHDVNRNPDTGRTRHPRLPCPVLLSDWGHVLEVLGAASGCCGVGEMSQRV